jgi:hypothetical protein
MRLLLLVKEHAIRLCNRASLACTHSGGVTRAIEQLAASETDP